MQTFQYPNLLVGTDPADLSKWRTWKTRLSLVDDGYIKVAWNGLSYGTDLGAFPQYVDKIPAGDYEVSFDAYADKDIALDYCYIMCNGRHNLSLGLRIQITTAPKTYSAKFNVGEDQADSSFMVGTHNADRAPFYVRHLMLVAGGFLARGRLRQGRCGLNER